jgi:regulator of protease activity HflC (stomatin/prohibitin superfamily)
VPHLADGARREREGETMTMHRKVEIGEAERGLLMLRGTILRFLKPGVHHFWWLDRDAEVRRLSLLNPLLDFPDLEFLVKQPALADEVTVVRLKDHERGLLSKDDNFQGFLGPGLHALLKSPAAATKVEVVDIHGLEVSHPTLDVLVHAKGSAGFIVMHEVPDGHQGLLLIDQVRQRLLPPGRHYFWTGLREVKVQLLDVREQTTEVQGQELMTKDKVTLRINLSARWKVTDPLQALTGQTDFREAFYREVQLALRDEVGAHTLDELLEHKEQIGQAITSRAGANVKGIGVQLESAGLRDIILPGEMRTILNQVIEAEKRAEANMIARREETAATRNLMNTAKLLEGNPVLMRLKENEAAERIAERIGSLSVVGGIDALVAALREAVRLGAKDEAKTDAKPLPPPASSQTTR